MTDTNQIFAIVPVNGKPPADAICWGTLGECTEFVAQSAARAETENRIASARNQLKNDAKVLAQAQYKTLDVATKLTAMGDAMLAAHNLKARKDAEAKRVKAEQAEAQRVQDLLDSLPDPDNPEAASGDDGELEVKTAPSTEHLQPQDGITGNFPTRLEKNAPRGGEYQETDINKLAHPQRPPDQPVAISLNAEV